MGEEGTTSTSRHLTPGHRGAPLLGQYLHGAGVGGVDFGRDGEGDPGRFVLFTPPRGVSFFLTYPAELISREGAAGARGVVPTVAVSASRAQLGWRVSVKGGGYRVGTLLLRGVHDDLPLLVQIVGGIALGGTEGGEVARNTAQRACLSIGLFVVKEAEL